MGHSLQSRMWWSLWIPSNPENSVNTSLVGWLSTTPFGTPESWTLWEFFPHNIIFHPSVPALTVLLLCPKSAVTFTLSKSPLLTVHQHKAQLKIHSTSRMGHCGEGKFIMITENELWKLGSEETSGGLQSVYNLFLLCFCDSLQKIFCPSSR